ncbi:hypothetical protein ACX12E_01240 [Paenibacillus vandeheii]
MKRLKSIVRFMWTGLQGVCRRIWWFFRTREGREMLSQMFIVGGGEFIKHFLGQ